jgi:hypothetical protein
MKKWGVGLMLLALAGCAATTAKPPAGCEQAYVWESGFMPEGRDAVELAVASLLVAEPALRPKVKSGALEGYRLVKAGSLRAAMGELLKLLEKYPRYTPLALFALQRLDLDRTLDRCDQEALMHMFRDIGVMAGAAESDFGS